MIMIMIMVIMRRISFSTFLHSNLTQRIAVKCIIAGLTVSLFNYLDLDAIVSSALNAVKGFYLSRQFDEMIYYLNESFPNVN
jgi:hypothetical protein